MFQESEVVNLLVGFGSVPVILALVRRVRFPGAPLLGAAFSSILAAYVLTVAEGVLWPELLNLLEHLAYGVAGLLFLTYLVLLRRERSPSPGQGA